jgi:hypothetical protein
VQRADAPIPVRIEAAHALAGTGDPALRVAVRSPVLALRAAAAEAAGTSDLPSDPLDPVVLGRGTTGPVPPGALADTRGRQIHLPQALRRGEIDALVALARSGPESDRFAAIAALGWAASGAAADEALRTLAKSGDTEPIRKAAYRSSKRLERIRRKAEPRP